LLLDIEPQCGLPVRIDTDTCEFHFGGNLNVPSLRTRMLHELDPVWANPVTDSDRIVYRYTGPLWFPPDAATWKSARVGYGIVYFKPGTFGGEYVKSSGQYHAMLPGQNAATPEVYTVLVGRGHFMLQRSKPPYEDIDDAVLVEVNAGETFVVPPDYGHLQINPTVGPLVFSYCVADPLTSNYEPYKRFHGAMYFEMAGGAGRFVFNPRYPRQVPLRVVKAASLRQLPFLDGTVDYAAIKRNLKNLGFLVSAHDFPAQAGLQEVRN